MSYTDYDIVITQEMLDNLVIPHPGWEATGGVKLTEYQAYTLQVGDVYKVTVHTADEQDPISLKSEKYYIDNLQSIRLAFVRETYKAKEALVLTSYKIAIGAIDERISFLKGYSYTIGEEVRLHDRSDARLIIERVEENGALHFTNGRSIHRNFVTPL